jgi:hypothetical protein
MKRNQPSESEVRLNNTQDSVCTGSVEEPVVGFCKHGNEFWGSKNSGQIRDHILI